MGILINDGVEYTDKPKLDKTLSIEGKAADAKAVGDTKISHADVVNNLESTATDLPASANTARALNNKITAINDKLGGFKTSKATTYGTTGTNTIDIGFFAGGCMYLLLIRTSNSNTHDGTPCALLISVANDKSSANIAALSRDNAVITSYDWNNAGFQWIVASGYSCKYTAYLMT